jgi:hypothetical protein
MKIRLEIKNAENLCAHFQKATGVKNVFVLFTNNAGFLGAKRSGERKRRSTAAVQTLRAGQVTRLLAQRLDCGDFGTAVAQPLGQLFATT